MGTYESVKDGILTVSKPIPSLTVHDRLTYKVRIAYRQETVYDDDGNVTFPEAILVNEKLVTFSLIKNPLISKTVDISGGQVFVVGTDGVVSPETIT